MARASGAKFTGALSFLNSWSYNLGAEILVARGRQEYVILPQMCLAKNLGCSTLVSFTIINMAPYTIPIPQLLPVRRHSLG